MNQQDPHYEFLVAYEKIHASFVRYCSSQAYGLLETEDLVQEAVLAALQNFDRIREKENLLGYLIGVVKNLVRQKAKRLKWRGAWDERLLEKLESQIVNPEIVMDVYLLLQAMNKLPALQREAILLFEISGLSIREIGEIQKSNEGAVKTRLSRGRKKLRSLLSTQPMKRSLADTMAVYVSLLL